jgi:hypothetical protein
MAVAGMTGKTLGEMTPEERRTVTERAMARLQAELTANADRISAIMDEAESEEDA